ncbi:MAG TPA: hypothetical protein DD640_00795 [Clostridiales bacterium]|nr:hypothetical protein [Clostridiales bacterium]
MRLFLGIDGGGTKTLFLLTDGEGAILSFKKLDGVDFNQIGADNISRKLQGGTADVLRQAGVTCHDLAAVCAGLPYLDESAEWSRQCPQILAEMFPGIPALCLNDSVVALYGALGLQPGINLVAGTGSIACGRDRNNNLARSGGWNEHISDEGSCYWLGQKLCSLFTKQADGRLPRGPLYHLVRTEFGLQSDFDLAAYYQEKLFGHRERIAALQIILARAAQMGDPSAAQAYVDAAAELAAIALAVKAKLFPGDDQPVPITCTGGLFKAGRIITDPLRRQLESRNLLWSQPILPPAAGAVLKACEIAGLKPAELMKITEKLKSEAKSHGLH